MTPADHDLHTLAGAYVLDAITDEERASFETHLAGCDECRADVAELREATARLGTATAVHPRPALRRQMIKAAAQTSQLAPVTPIPDRAAGRGQDPRRSPGDRRRDGAWRRALTGTTGWQKVAVAAAVTVLAGAAGVSLVMHDTMSQLQHSRRQDHQIVTVLNASDAVMRTARISSGGMAIVVLSHHEHMGVFTAHDLRALPAAENYELWLMGPGGDRPAGLLKTMPGGMAQPAVISGMHRGDKIGLTIEPAGGSRHPTTATLVLIGQRSR